MTVTDPELAATIHRSGVKIQDECRRFDCGCQLYRMKTGSDICLAGHHQIKHDIRQ